MLRDFVGQHVQMIRHALGVLGLLEMPSSARAKLEARGEALESEHVFQCEQRTSLGVVDHQKLRDHAWVRVAFVGPPMQST